MTVEYQRQVYTFTAAEAENRLMSGSYIISFTEIGIDLGNASPVNGQESNFVLWVDVFMEDLEMSVMTANECITNMFFFIGDDERDTIIQKAKEMMM